MMARNYATRMTCFSLISGIEADLRDTIYSESIDKEINDVFPPDTESAANDRFNSEQGDSFNTDNSLRDILDYVDFYDLSKILHKISDKQSIFALNELQYITSNLEELTPVRNRVCHSRPLSPTDLTSLIDFARELITRLKNLRWTGIRHAIENLENVKFALALSIPDFWKPAKASIEHNLPLPEFDDTGFMGREKDRKSLRQLILSNTKVISIVGEGGIGKTAIAQRVLYDILEICEEENDEERPFDIIIWISLKLNKLTANGVDQIHQAISSSTGLFQNISSALVGQEPNKEIGSMLAEIHEYMDTFRILLCIDNLETISGKEIRDFLANIPNQSKILITTRIGLGEIEYRYKLDPLDDKSSISLMRTMSKLLNINVLYKKRNAALMQYCKRLYFNPLLIKWFVLSIAGGKNAEDLLNKQGSNFGDALRYCFENLFDQLGGIEKRVISIIACLRMPVSTVQLRFYLDDVPEIDTEEALNQLFNSSMLYREEQEFDSSEKVYNLTGIAEEYLNSVKPVPNELYLSVREKRKELQVGIEKIATQKNRYKYDYQAIEWKTSDEKICSIYLQKALREAGKDMKRAEEYISQAKSIMPGFSECYRIHGAILAKEDLSFRAETEYEKAIELNPSSIQTRYAYSLFLRRAEDWDRSLAQLDAALLLGPDEIDSIPLKTSKAWILTIIGIYDEAAKIYEGILTNIDQIFHKKFRISAYDQASSCHRRYADQALSDKDYDKAGKHLAKSVSIIGDSINSGDYDVSTISHIGKVLRLAEIYYRKSGDASVEIFAIKLLGEFIDSIHPSHLTTLKTELNNYLLICNPENSAKVADLLQRIEISPSLTEGAEIIGQVHNVQKNDDGTVKFGFIIDNDENRYYFQRRDLCPQNILDQNNPNIYLIFYPRTAEKGPVAQNIKLYVQEQS